MDTHLLAYMAGAMDSDGFFSIKRSTYHVRVRGDAVHPTYSERIGLKQVTEDIPRLLKNAFGGTFAIVKGGTPNSRFLYSFHCTDKQAANACNALLPFLRVKRRQAELLLELRQSKEGRYWQASYWFEREYPQWRELELITFAQVTEMLGYQSVGMVGQCVRGGTLLALPYDHLGTVRPRVPKLLVERLRQLRGRGMQKYVQPPQLIAWKEQLWQGVRDLNKNGIDGTPSYHRTGIYEPIK